MVATNNTQQRQQGFHFSPRPNRASEINWRHWSREAFEEAKSQDKLILLGISGVWCHWCHVMDETSYSQGDIIKVINRDLVAIRVDTDQRPDINARYNLGGWPTTAVLSPDGELLTGGTYIPPERLKPWLTQVVQEWKENRDRIESRVNRVLKRENIRQRMVKSGSLDQEIYNDILAQVLASYDQQYGGFGEEPKFPMISALELALEAHLATGNKQLLEVMTYTLEAMSGGGTYDPEEGGFFRYSVTRDWSIPHFEKMLEDNAKLLRLLAWTHLVTGEEHFESVARDVLRYLLDNLYLPSRDAWAGTQDADEDYYSLEMPDRRRGEAPYIDKTIYTDWNGLMAQALFACHRVFGDKKWLRLGLDTLSFIKTNCYREDGGLAHYYIEGPELWNQLMDQVEVGIAAAEAYEITMDQRWLAFSEELARFALEKLAAPEGGLYDSTPEEDQAYGALSRPLLLMEENARAARWLILLHKLTENSRYLDSAEGCLRSFAGSRRRHGLMAAEYALAIGDFLNPWTVVSLVGDPADPKMVRMQRACLTNALPRRALREISSVQDANTDLSQWPDIDEGKTPVALIRVGDRAIDPIYRLDRLGEALNANPDMELGIAEEVLVGSRPTIDGDGRHPQ